MELLLILMISLMYAGGVYMILRRSFVKLLIGILLLGNGSNLLIFLLGNLIKGKPPVISENLQVFDDIYADPVPQALILTAIVIGFGLSAFAIVLLKRAYIMVDSDNLDDLNTPEEDI